MVGARPVFVDVLDDYNINPALIEQAITPHTKVILPVHLTGRPADMAPILEIARKYGLYVVEDCAQAVSAEYRGQRVGSLGDVGCFSLHPLKTLNACGDGGVLTTNDPALAQEFKVLRNIGLKERDDCVLWGHNSRLDTIQAAMLLVKLDYLDQWTEQRQSNAQNYRELLGGMPQVQCPIDQNYERSVYHTFIVQADRRDSLKAHLTKKGVGTAIHYPIPIHLHKAAEHLGYSSGDFPVSERQAQRIISLPVYPELSTEQMEYVAASVCEFYE
jgi:dTDP-4-amino-4,6-dideoxygalactose transaminase